MLVILALLVIIAGCNGGKEYCSVVDKRFSCEYSLTENSIDVKFMKAPSGKYYMVAEDLYKVIDEDSGEETRVGECQITGSNFPEEGSTIKFTCLPKEEGRYTLSFDIKHTEMPSYSPASGETCLKTSSQWQCTTGGHLSFNVE